MNRDVDSYFVDGCGRCPLGGTPECKVHFWPDALMNLRRIMLECGLTEESKWGVPCYTFNDKNVAIVAAFKEYASLSFFKGALLKDEAKILLKSGENTQAGRLIKFTTGRQVLDLEITLKAYIYEAIEVEKLGLKVEMKKELEPIPDEFQKKLDEFPDLKNAFESLTLGKQRGYILHFSQPKQSKTRETRIEKYLPKILNGKGFFD